MVSDLTLIFLKNYLKTKEKTMKYWTELSKNGKIAVVICAVVVLIVVWKLLL